MNVYVFSIRLLNDMRTHIVVKAGTYKEAKRKAIGYMCDNTWIEEAREHNHTELQYKREHMCTVKDDVSLWY